MIDIEAIRSLATNLYNLSPCLLALTVYRFGAVDDLCGKGEILSVSLMHAWLGSGDSANARGRLCLMTNRTFTRVTPLRGDVDAGRHQDNEAQPTLVGQHDS